MKRVLTAVVLIALVLALIFWRNQDALTAFAAVVACLAAWEYAGLTRASGSPVPLWWLLPAVALFFVVADINPLLGTLPMLWLLGIVLFAYSSFRGDLQHALSIATAGFFGLIYIAYPLSLLPQFLQKENSVALLLFLMLTVWTGDTVALYVGRAFGKHKLAPRISPGKTWEGSAASIAGSILIAGALIGVDLLLESRGFTLLHISEPVWQTLVLAALVNAAAQLGDLLESAVKRGVGVKDSGTMLPGHGGVLDRIDALLVAAPALWLLLLIKDAVGLGGF